MPASVDDPFGGPKPRNGKYRGERIGSKMKGQASEQGTMCAAS